MVLSSGIEGTFERVCYLREIEKLQDFLDQSGWFDKTQSFADMVKEINRIVEDLPPGEHYLPDEDAVVRELLLFTDAEDQRPYVSDDLAQTRIDVRHHINSSRNLKHAIAQINDFVATNIDPGLTVTLTGDSVLTQRAGDELAAGQAKSLLLIVVAILLITSLLFLNIRAGHLAFVPNVLPIVILFGVTGFAGVPLNPGTAMVAAIGVGVCVDDTMHFLVRYNREMTLQPSVEDAIRSTIEAEFRPIASTSVALTLGFAVFTLSKFPPVVHFGALGALVILLAFLANFFITPILLSYLRLVTLWDLLDVRLRSQLVEKCMLFRGMGWFEVRQVIIMGNRKSFEPGDYVVRRGDESGELYVILDGEVQVQRHGAKGAAETSTRMQFGDVFGEVAMVANRQRHWDVVAVRKTEVLMLCWGDLQGLSRFMPRTYSRLLLNMASDFGQRLMSRRF